MENSRRGDSFTTDILETGHESGEVGEQAKVRVHSSGFNTKELVTTAYTVFYDRESKSNEISMNTEQALCVAC
jgi:hypothetical protein